MNHIEDQEQMKIFRWAALQENVMPELRQLHAIPNGGYRSKATAAILKSTGVKAGVPDICLPVPRRDYHGLYIELKRPDGGRTSKLQNEWLEALALNGYFCEVCHGAESAIKTIRWYLGK